MECVALGANACEPGTFLGWKLVDSTTTRCEFARAKLRQLRPLVFERYCFSLLETEEKESFFATVRTETIFLSDVNETMILLLRFYDSEEEKCSLRCSVPKNKTSEKLSNVELFQQLF